MPRMNPTMRAKALITLDERQRKFCEINGLVWRGLFCESLVRGSTWDEKKGCVRIVEPGDVAKGGLYGGVDHDGNKCKGELCVDHEDNNNDNNPEDGSNWRVRCRGHNGRKNHRGKTQKPNNLDLLKNKSLKESLESIGEKLKAFLKKEGRESEGNKDNIVMRSAEHEKSKRCRKAVAECVREMLSEGDDVEILLYDLSLTCASYTEQVFGDGEGITREKAAEYIEVLAAPRIGEFEIFNKATSGKRPVWWVRRRVELKAESV